MQTDRRQFVLGKQAAYLWTWWRDDPLTLLPAEPGWHVETSDERAFLAQLPGFALNEALDRCQMGHRAYVAFLDRTLVAYGWVATNEAAFGHPTVKFQVPENNTYLYHFVTLLPWRGRSFYPRLLQEILLREGHACERFWIIHQLVNRASQRGIAKAGFQIANGVFHARGGRLALVSHANQERAQAGAELLGLPLIE